MDIGIEADPRLLIANQGATSFGTRLTQIDPLRPPVALGAFPRESPITNKFSANIIAISDSARNLSCSQSLVKRDGSQVKNVDLLWALHAAPVTLSQEKINLLPLDGELIIRPD